MSQVWRLIGFGGFLGLLVMVGSEESFAKNKKAAPKEENYGATPAEYKKLQNAKELVGKLVAVDGAAKALTIRVDSPHTEPNPNYKPPKDAKGTANNQIYTQYAQMQKTYADLQRQQQLAMLAKNPQERQRALARVQQDMQKLQQLQAQLQAKMNAAAAKPGVKEADPKNQPFITVSSFKDYELDLQDAVVVRKLFLPMEYDDTGNMKTYTEKEKEELRGKDRTKPGYIAKLEDLLPTQEVKISLTAPKIKKKEKDAPKEKDADKEKDVKEEVVVERPTINMIVMTKELPPGSGIVGGNDKKKKKK